MMIKIGSRKSKLAMWQANYVLDLLEKEYNNKKFIIEGISTVGDDNQNIPLSQFSDKGVFTKQLDIALLNGTIDLAVHCVKDLPTILPNGLQICTILKRGDREDALVLHEKHKDKSFHTLPKGSIIGTSSVRRRASMKHIRGDELICHDIRGNLQTRLGKLDSGKYDGIILAVTGLKRMGLNDRISQVLDLNGYAVGQGALAIVCRKDDVNIFDLCSKFNDNITEVQCLCERTVLYTLEGGCKVPIAVQCEYEPQVTQSKNSNNKKQRINKKSRISLVGTVYSACGKHRLQCSGTIQTLSNEATALKLYQTLTTRTKQKPSQDILMAIELGFNIAQQLLKMGANEILEKIKQDAAKSS